MGDELNTNLQSEQAGQPVNSSNAADVQSQPSATENADGGTPQYVTKDEALKMAREAATDAIRQAQSLTDKAQARIMQEVNRLKQNGIQATPEQVQKMIVSEERAAAQSQQSDISSQQAAQPGQETSDDPVVRKAFKIMNEDGGGQIPQDAPEFKLIDAETDDVEVFLNSVRTASKAYAARTQNLSNPARNPSLAGGTGTHTPSHLNKTGAETLDEYFNRLTK